MCISQTQQILEPNFRRPIGIISHTIREVIGMTTQQEVIHKYVYALRQMVKKTTLGTLQYEKTVKKESFSLIF